MSACNFEYLLQLLNKQLDLDKQIEVFDHLERCDICRDAIHQISRDLGASSSIAGSVRRHTISGAISMRQDLGARR
jgi:hypothetical protein